MSLNDDPLKRVSPEVKANEALTRTHILKMPDRSFVNFFWFLLVIFILCPLIIDPPLTDWTFPPAVIESATKIMVINIIILLAGAVYISFYRKDTSIQLDERGVTIQGKPFIPWQSIKWYNFAIFSNRCVRSLVLKTSNRKIRIVSEDGHALMEFEKDLKLFITTHNPSAYDYKKLKAYKNWGFAYMAMVAIAYIAGGIILEFNLIYMLMGIFTLPVIFLMIYVENIRGKPWNLFD